MLSVAAVLYVALLGFIWQSHLVLSRKIDSSVAELRKEIRGAITELRGEMAEVRDDTRMLRTESNRSREGFDERLRGVEHQTASLAGHLPGSVTDP